MRSAGVSETAQRAERDEIDAIEGVRIRRLSYSDLPSVISIERRSFPTPWSLAMFVLELSKPSGICLAAVDGAGRLAGYLVCSRYDTVWHLMNVAIDPERRRQGIATTLINRLFEEGGSQSPYTLEVRVSNREAIVMYERFGFRSAGLRHGYYHDNGEDAVIMWYEHEAERAGALA
jgi:ribosomal-protein-alanine N-acetyltransferase